MIALVAGPQRERRFVQGLGAPYLAAVLQEAGFRVEIFDLYPYSPETDNPAVLEPRLADAIAARKPDIVGISLHTPDYAFGVRLARLLRERLPLALLVAGGHHPTAEPENLLGNSDFDVCVVGEGEQALPELANRYMAGREEADPEWLAGIPGVVYKRNGRVLQKKPGPPVQNLDSLPFPAHDLLGLECYTAHPLLGIRTTSIITYRGCPMRCAFCVNPQGRRVRRRSPRKIVDEMTRVVDVFGVRGFSFCDNLFGLDRAHATAVCEEIARRRPDVFWECWTAGDLIDPELARKMKAAGCIKAGVGAESGDSQVLRKSKRGLTPARSQAGIDALRGAGLKVDAFFMIGLPGESEKSIRVTIDFAASCGADTITLSVYRPYPGTAIWNDPDAFGVRITRGPDFEAYAETERLSRAAILEATHEAIDELKQGSFARVGSLRFDEYEWE